ncbi:PHA/PHB synthase family protein [Microvirga alba]|uniref:Polyhydroxyalkanoic acid synthase n=1 Tax=Microvirga alba TaxID=2791025 RepID=A0A931BKL5_9HYPH|nr:alpha/beta fold hydrolase [Microvirga alba]MBF9232661.1 polyhydroxyalkanoic acid synthase [Microvirga alba]
MAERRRTRLSKKRAIAAPPGRKIRVPVKPMLPIPPKSPPPLEDLGNLPLTTEIGEDLDRAFHASVARLTSGLSPAALMGAFLDWGTHLATAPGKQLELIDKTIRKLMRLGQYCIRSREGGQPVEPCIEPLPQDHRFSAVEWQAWPFNVTYQSFLLQQQWWYNATTHVNGVTKQHERVVEFVTRQLLDMAAPSNFIPTNPLVLQKTLETGGMNLFQGMRNLFEDWERVMAGRKPIGADKFQVGRDVARAPGRVIYRNHLIELIQYLPTTAKVRPEPVLIVPAWIMKYYILDLSPENSLVRYLVEQGFTVFMISWRNPTESDRSLSLDNYRTDGIMAAVKAIRTIVPRQRIHATGYCLGGTLLLIAAAAMARDGDDSLKSVSLFAAEADFTEAGELMLFINESQVNFLEDLMWQQGYLDAKQMAGAFQLLRSNDLIWSRWISQYLMGEREPINDLMAWNADATRLPFRMHSEYLRRLFLNNDLAEGRFHAEGRPVALTDIRVPIFALGTEYDHVAPWRSVYKIHLLSDADVTFVLTAGGHNAGVVSEPGHPDRSYHVMTRFAQDHYLDPDTWRARAQYHEGSWWPEWVEWLAANSGAPQEQPDIGAEDAGYAPLAEAPGSYVLEP